MRKWYQNLPVEGAVCESADREGSKFWNEGKWNNFIAPLLPGERQTFLDIGCNAGLMLKLARDAGFKRAIGIDASLSALRQARQYRESVGGDWTLIPQVVGVNLNLDSLPLADVTLLANVHYYIPIGEFAKLVDRLRHRTLYCIVVSGKASRRGDRAHYSMRAVRGYFRDWTEAGVVDRISGKGDPAPRPYMYGILFEGALDSQNVPEKYKAMWDGHVKSSRFHFCKLPPALKEFFELVFSGTQFRYEDTLLYKYWRVRDANHSPESALNRLAQKQALAEDVRDNGIREPIYYDHRGHFVDGLTRLCIAQELGYEHIIARSL